MRLQPSPSLLLPLLRQQLRLVWTSRHFERSRKVSLLRSLSSGLVALSLAGCAHQTPTLATKPVAAPAYNAGCLEFPRLSYDRLFDTAPTIEQVKQYNAARDAVCGVGK